MPVCALKFCSNNSTKNKKDTGITYHRFPRDPIISDRWTAVARLNRGNWWKPSKCSVICSAHFNKSDFYVTKGGLQRLCKETIPQNALFLSSMQPNNIYGKRTVTLEPSTSDPDNAATSEPCTSYLNINETSDPQLTHDQIHCDHCNNEIKGFRYKCLQCEDFDLCQACEAAGMHCDHYMLRIPKPRPEQEVAALLQTLRAHLPESVESEQTVPEVHDQAGPSHQKSNIKSAKKTKPVNVTNQTTQNKSDTQETNASSSEPHIDYLNYPIKTEIESEVLVDSQSTNLEYFDPLKTEPTSSVTDTPLLSFVVPNTYSIPLIVSSTPHLQIDPTSMTICSVDTNTVKIEPSEIEPSEVAGTDSITVFSHSKTKPKQTSTTNTGSSGTSKPPAKKRMKPN